MLLYVLAEDILSGLGQIAATILAIYMFVFIIIGLAVSAGLMFGLAWVRQKAELIKKLRPVVDSVNTASEAGLHGALPAPRPNENKIIHTIAEVPAGLHTVEEKVDEGADRVAKAVIEFRARTMQVQTVLKALLLPGLTKQKPGEIEKTGVEFKSPGYRTLIEQAAPTPVVPAVPGTGSTQSVTAQDLKAVGSTAAQEPLIGSQQTKDASVR
jgi:hypothetical protein